MKLCSQELRSRLCSTAGACSWDGHGVFPSQWRVVQWVLLDWGPGGEGGSPSSTGPGSHYFHVADWGMERGGIMSRRYSRWRSTAEELLCTARLGLTNARVPPATEQSNQPRRPSSGGLLRGTQSPKHTKDPGALAKLPTLQTQSTFQIPGPRAKEYLGSNSMALTFPGSAKVIPSAGQSSEGQQPPVFTEMKALTAVLLRTVENHKQICVTG